MSAYFRQRRREIPFDGFHLPQKLFETRNPQAFWAEHPGTSCQARMSQTCPSSHYQSRQREFLITIGQTASVS